MRGAIILTAFLLPGMLLYGQQVTTDSVFLFYPQSRLVESRTGILANQKWVYVDFGPGQLMNARLGFVVKGRVQVEYNGGYGELHYTEGWKIRGGLLVKLPVFLALSASYHEDIRHEYKTGCWVSKEPPPREFSTFLSTLQLECSYLATPHLLLTVNTGLTHYERAGKREQIPLTLGVSYELFRVLQLKFEADLYSRQEELQNTSLYSGFALMLPFVDLELGYLYHNGYMREGGYDGPYCCIALYM